MVLLDLAIPLPPLHPNNTLSFYPYPSHSDSHSHVPGPSTTSRVPPRPNPVRGPIPPALPTSTPNVPKNTMAGPSMTSNREEDGGRSQLREQEQRIDHQALLRALTGKRPAGMEVSKVSESLEEEEGVFEDYRHSINMFGNRFLLPYGLRLTQMEMDAQPSPEPSEPDQDRRQEDGAVPSAPRTGRTDVGIQGDVMDGIEEGVEEVEGDEEVDLDASVEDMDDGMMDG
ncbi:hypothetical protein M231_07368 [Tremella mesenterica]|uniref:Uncharacterized protein n=1 Tax=Tremella mesenterica TaxID=5217 RepID=A0A4Q1B9C6_TREME|nr:hypothetical protein M231_07368 [Tremella mesenterica]